MQKVTKKTTMTDIVPHAGSAGTKNPMLSLFKVPPMDLSISSYRMVPIQMFTTGINPVEFQIVVGMSRRVSSPYRSPDEAELLLR